MKDWKGNSKAIFSTHGATNHSEGERASEDYYATNPKAIDALFAVETFSKRIWEPACGGGHLSNRMKELGKSVMTSDLIDRGHNNIFRLDREGHVKNDQTFDFLCDNLYRDISFPPPEDIKFDIITNPPYSLAKEFCFRALAYRTEKVAMFLKLTFLESKGRTELFEKYPPRYVYVFTNRIDCAKNGDFSHTEKAVAYAWFVWYRDFKGNPEIKWI